MNRAAPWIFTILATAACSPSLPDGYAVISGDRGKSWLANPDGTLAHGGLIKQLFRDDRHILLITPAATAEGKIDGLQPSDGSCYVALLIDARAQRTRQVRLAEAYRIAANMTLVESSHKGCLEGTPT